MIDLTKVEHIHCIGIGGVGLSAIADILVARGKTVSGSDMNQNDKVQRLMKKGVKIALGHRAKNMEGAQLVVYSSAVSAENPELVAAREKGVTCVNRAEMLGELMKGYKNSIAIAGTHGKTTTTSMISLILKEANLDPTILVGGNLAEIDGNVKIGSSPYFVTEACEYMDSFLELKPKIEIILNIDSDHLDYFKDIEHITQSFEKFINLLPEDGILFAYDANPFVKRLIKDRDNVVTFGFSRGCTYCADYIEFNGNGQPAFSVTLNGEHLCNIQLCVPGEHNLLNALVAVACCHHMGVDVDTIVKTLAKYKGTQRRFDELGETESGMRIVDDYAHHPTEIKATLSAVKNMRHKDIWCIFQPHTYTRTIALFDEFPEAFEGADKVILAEIYGAREKNIHKISAKELMLAIKAKYPQKGVYFFKEFEEIADFVYNHANPEDLVITMGAGDVYHIGEMILENDGVNRGGKMRGEKIL